jgi:hypothetical protein
MAPPFVPVLTSCSLKPPGSKQHGAINQDMFEALPSVKLTVYELENHHFSLVNQLFLWPFSIAMLVYWRVGSQRWSSWLFLKLSAAQPLQGLTWTEAGKAAANITATSKGAIPQAASCKGSFPAMAIWRATVCWLQPTTKTIGETNYSESKWWIIVIIYLSVVFQGNIEYNSGRIAGSHCW